MAVDPVDKEGKADGNKDSGDNGPPEHHYFFTAQRPAALPRVEVITPFFRIFPKPTHVPLFVSVLLPANGGQLAVGPTVPIPIQRLTTGSIDFNTEQSIFIVERWKIEVPDRLLEELAKKSSGKLLLGSSRCADHLIDLTMNVNESN